MDNLKRHPISVLIRDEDVGMILAHSWMHIPSGASEEAAGHGWKFKAGDSHQGVEGQVYVISVEREGGEDPHEPRKLPSVDGPSRHRGRGSRPGSSLSRQHRRSRGSGVQGGGPQDRLEWQLDPRT